jgi:hypothetical protein
MTSELDRSWEALGTIVEGPGPTYVGDRAEVAAADRCAKRNAERHLHLTPIGT